MPARQEPVTRMNRNAPVKTDEASQLKSERLHPSERKGAMDLMRKETSHGQHNQAKPDFNQDVVNSISKRSGFLSKGDSAKALTAIDDYIDKNTSTPLEQRLDKARDLIGAGFSKEATSHRTIREMAAGYKLILEKNGLNPDQIQTELSKLATQAIEKHLKTCYKTNLNDFEKRGLFNQSQAIAVACGLDREGFNKIAAGFITQVANSQSVALTNIEKGGLQRKWYIVTDLAKTFHLQSNDSTPTSKVTDAHKTVRDSIDKVASDLEKAGFEYHAY
jgi:hypothetical protein